MEDLELNPILLKAVIERNNTIDRPFQDWINEGRSTTGL